MILRIWREEERGKRIGEGGRIEMGKGRLIFVAVFVSVELLKRIVEEMEIEYGDCRF